MFYAEKKYLEYVRKFPRYYPSQKDRFEDHFEFNSLSDDIYIRFIELLLPITNHYFRKTSKHNYVNCLDLRGIEVENLISADYVKYHGYLLVPSGKLRLNLNKVPTNWTKLLVVTGNVSITKRGYEAVPEVEKLDFVKKNTQLIFTHGFPEQLECLIHPGLEEVGINAYSLEFDHLLRCLKKLNVCQHFESIYFCDDKVQSAAAFKQLKQQLEQLAGRHQHAEISCNLGYNKEFQIHENVLCHCPKPGVFVKDYNFEDLRRY